MEAAARQDELERKNNQATVRGTVMQAIGQINQAKAKDFNEVCERLEKKYLNA